jgi:hypothetical protein
LGIFAATTIAETARVKGDPLTVAPSEVVTVIVALVAVDVAGVYVNVFAELELDQLKDVGENVPPAPPSEKVAVSVVVADGVNVNVVATPANPCEAPVSVKGR